MEIFALFRDGFIGLVSDVLNSHVKVIVSIVMEQLCKQELWIKRYPPAGTLSFNRVICVLTNLYSHFLLPFLVALSLLKHKAVFSVLKPVL